VSLCPRQQQIHIILDNLSAHKTQSVREFLEHEASSQLSEGLVQQYCKHYIP